MLLHTGTPFSNAILAIFERIDAGIPAAVRTRIPAVLLHPDAEDDSIPFRQLGRFDIRLLSPVDLAVTKIGRYEGNDQADIAALAREGLLEPQSLKERAEEAIGYYIGDTSRVLTSLGLALETVLAETPPPAMGSTIA